MISMREIVADAIGCIDEDRCLRWRDGDVPRYPACQNCLAAADRAIAAVLTYVPTEPTPPEPDNG